MRSTESTEANGGAVRRRQAIAWVGRAIGAAMGAMTYGAGALSATRERVTQGQAASLEGLLTYLHQEIDFKTTPQRIYEALLDAKQFAAFTGMPAEINREAGGAFSTFGGLIQGRNVELIANQRIVQAWRPGSWDAGVYSIVRFELKALEGKTRLVLDHTGFPEGNFRHLDAGWYARYWEPLKKFLAS